MKKVILLITAISAVAGFASVSFANTDGKACNKQASAPIWANTAPKKIVREKAKEPTRSNGNAVTKKGVS